MKDKKIILIIAGLLLGVGLLFYLYYNHIAYFVFKLDCQRRGGYMVMEKKTSEYVDIGCHKLEVELIVEPVLKTK